MTRSSLAKSGLAYLALAVIALVIHAPALHGGFLWDDTDWIRDNETLRSWAGLWRIWTEPGAVIQYYPLTYTSWWLDYQVWSLSPLAMRVENVLLHAGCALLFGGLLRRMDLPGAAVAALLFLVHPVHVESVAWIVERKNTLSTLLYLGALHAWLSHLDGPARRHQLSALLLFAAALLAKTATLMLPVALLAMAMWRTSSWRTRLPAMAPFAALSVFAAVVTIVMERGEGAVGHDWALTTGERIALLGQNVGFYAMKLLVPIDLSFVYAKWNIAASSLTGWLPTTALLAVGIATLRARRRPLVAASLALCLFVANLLPVSGLVDFYYLRYAFAADHFQYLPSLAPIALLGCGGAWLLRQKPRGIVSALAAIVIIVLGLASRQRAALFTDMDTLWRATIAAEPDAWLAHTNLGNLLASHGNPDDGIEHHRRAVAIYEDAFESNNAIGNYLTRRSRFDEARQFFARAQRARPDHPLTCNNYGVMAASQGNEREALAWFEKGHARAPRNRDLLRNLTQMLSQARDPALRDGPRALRLARLLNASAETSLFDEYALFRAMLLGGSRSEAIIVGQRTLQRAQDEGEDALAQRLREQLQRLGH